MASSPKPHPPLATDCRCGHTYNWHVPGGVCQVPNCVCKLPAPRDADWPKDTPIYDCHTCQGSGAHPDCDGAGCSDCDPDTGNCPTCCGTGNDPKHWQRARA